MARIEHPVEDRTLAWLSGVYAFGGVSLLAVTWRLWSGQHEFPQIPMFRFAVAIPRFLDAGILAMLVAALVVTFGPRTRRLGWVCFAAAWAASAALDQHRVQVWAWHLSLCGLVIATSTPRDAIRRLQWLTIGIYGWSAFSRVDIAFVRGLGARIAEGLALGLGFDRMPSGASVVIASGFPIGEALIALLLGFERTRRIGLAGSMIMHGCLLIALGPFGLGHEWGVLLWNLVLVAQNVLLFLKGPSEVRRGQLSPQASTSSRWTGTAVLLMAICPPALLPLGCWDVWPSWAVYSARGGSTAVLVHADDIPRVPVQARAHVRDAAPFSDWHAVDIDAWSRRVLHCPVNPDGRFRFGVAAALAPYGRVRIKRRSAPNRWTGASETATWDLADGRLPPEIRSMFWLNLEPRRERP
jgi:hypothetical protein